LFTWTDPEHSVLGGTDICSLFAGVCSALPVFRGEIQCRLLGMAVTTFSAEGKPSVKGESGELVCLKVAQEALIIFAPFTHARRGFHDSSLSHVSPWGSGLCLATPMMRPFWLRRRDTMMPTLQSMKVFGVSALISAPRGPISFVTFFNISAHITILCRCHHTPHSFSNSLSGPMIPFCSLGRFSMAHPYYSRYLWIPSERPRRSCAAH
jgi:hypothetical protein